MKNWTIRRQINFGFATVLIITAALGAAALWHLKTIQRYTDVVATDCLPGIYVIGKIETQVRIAEKLIRDHVLADTPEEVAAVEAGLGKTRETASKLYEEYQKTLSAVDLPSFEKIMAIRPEYTRLRNEVLEQSRAGHKKEAVEIMKRKLQPVLEKYMDAVRELVDLNKEEADKYTELTAAAGRKASWQMLGGVGTALLAGVLTAWVIVHRTNGAVTKVATAIRDGANQVSSASGQVASASQSLAEGSTEQAASLEETSASLEEMAGMTAQNSTSSAKANDLARQAREAADGGARDMQAMSAAMTDIKASSDDIAKIIKTIDEIAFQTNILALNAAVEAARAGEAGLGFAVVADEVRNLAQRSAQAARETADKIASAINKTAQGVQLSEKVARSLGEIVEKVRGVDTLVAEVATASREQSEGVKQINTAVGQMDKVVQNNAAAAEESAAAGEELNAQARSLLGTVEDLNALVGARSVAAAAATPSPIRTAAPSSRPIGRPIRKSAPPPRSAPAVAGVNGHENFFAES